MTGRRLELLYGLAALKAMLRQRIGVESCLYTLSEAGYGPLSASLREARRMAEVGTPLREALRHLSSKRGGEIGYVLSTMAEALNSPNPESFIDSAFEKVRGEIRRRQRLIAESIPRLSEAFYAFSFLMPLLAASMIFVAVALGGLGPIIGLPYIEPKALTRVSLTILISLLSALVVIAWWRSR